ncbi:rRNA maturation RNase YbeY [Thiospirillum jenense]|uniref:Endoribonuclease YbeY n=1 Tax=Thiospirillum jenense TaxID=1653858 RepID=A0A839H6N3_9GAMM|nr:rRNA maturation RNase YbeY [Thiospirillum jenense]MBB1125403.1 rRNA maturation RNase YbeY [Thiospirillum jenense]
MPRSTVTIDLQRATTIPTAQLPTPVQLKTWVTAVRAALKKTTTPIELTIRLVDSSESAAFNQRYRGRAGATNVLSFPFINPPGAPSSCALLGDLMLCAPLVIQEAHVQQKELFAHWAHLVVHGALHLHGFDHQDANEAAQMEQLETQIVTGLGFAAPYEVI